MSTPFLPEVVPEIDANPMNFYGGGGLSGLELDSTVICLQVKVALDSLKLKL